MLFAVSGLCKAAGCWLGLSQLHNVGRSWGRAWRLANVATRGTTTANTSATTQPFVQQELRVRRYSLYISHRYMGLVLYEKRLCVAAAAPTTTTTSAAAAVAVAESLQQSQLAHPAAVSWPRRLLQQGRTALPSKDIDIDIRPTSTWTCNQKPESKGHRPNAKCQRKSPVKRLHSAYIKC